MKVESPGTRSNVAEIIQNNEVSKKYFQVSKLPAIADNSYMPPKITFISMV